MLTPPEDLPAVTGFRFASAAAGLKKNGALDLAVAVADRSVPAAAVLTTNRVRAAPVVLTAERLPRGMGRARALLVNAGNANACTGKAGMAAARRTTATLARALDARADEVYPASTGVIGTPLPVDRIEAAIPELVDGLSPNGIGGFAHAILTTDRFPKATHRRLRLGRTEVTLVGVAKGAGMIHPNMATTLGFLFTDAAVRAPTLRRILREAVAETFNQVSVDGDTSTNDTVWAVASGASGAAAERTDRDVRHLAGAIRAILLELAEALVSDGEGARHLVRIHVRGAVSSRQAARAADAVAGSLLVKTALHGQDPNWGRILAALGRSGIAFEPDRVAVRVGDTDIVRGGVGCGAAAEKLARVTMGLPRYDIYVTVGRGAGAASRTTCDLGTEYVRINADYRS